MPFCEKLSLLCMNRILCYVLRLKLSSDGMSYATHYEGTVVKSCVGADRLLLCGDVHCIVVNQL